MDRFGAVFLHFLRGVFDVSTGTTSAARISDDFDGFPGGIDIESPFPIRRRPEAFAASATPVTVANNNTDFHSPAPITHSTRISRFIEENISDSLCKVFISI